MKTLHPFQQDIVTELRRGYMQGHKRQLVTLATGAGKTVVASHLIHGASQAGRMSLFIVDRIQLVQQAVQHLQGQGLSVGVYQSENTDVRESDEAVVASIQTIRSRGAHPSGFVVIDEAHILHQAHIDLLNAWDAVPFIGLSATPLRPDLGKYFTHLVRGPTVEWLTANGFLTPVRAYCPSAAQLDALLDEVKVKRGDFVEGQLADAMNSKELIGDIVETWQRKAEDRPTLVFAINIAHSKAITEDFQAAGIEAQHIDAFTDQDERHEIIEAFRAGEVRILSSVNVLGIGFDVPDASCGILARPTLSEALHMQQIGRMIRPAEGKSDALLLDHSGNTIRFGLPSNFVVPELGHDEHRSMRQKRKDKRMTACSDCGAVIEPDQFICPACGIDRPTRQTDIVYRDGNLIEYGTDDNGEKVYSQGEKRAWYDAFLWHADRRGWKRGWAFHAYLAKFNDKPPWSWRNDPGACPTAQQARWIRYHLIRNARQRA